MNTPNVPISSEGATPKILLIGDISKAFLDTSSIINKDCEVHTNMLDAINAAAKNNFTAIGIVMAGISAKLSSALKTLRQVNSNAKIILLAQMYEEPIARQFVSPASNPAPIADGQWTDLSLEHFVTDYGTIGAGLADDYLICPIQTERFYASIMSGPDFGQSQAIWPAAVNTKLEMRVKHLERLATTDDLTGLKNRRYIWEFSRQILEHAQKENGRVTLLIFDIDNFKHYNDVYGHSVGDKILKQAAVLMRRCCRSHDVVGRIGGDEFAVVFWDDPQLNRGQRTEDRRRKTAADHPKEVIFIAKRFRREFEKAELHLLGPKGEGILTISGGLASFPRDGSAVQELFQKADKALLEAKRSGKNRIYLVGRPQSDIADIE
ncbi:MAG: GGDEF domain-containing protein [Sedimentisphaerales bacterium]